MLDGFSHSDRESVEPLLHPDLEWRTVVGPPLGVEAISGRDAMLRFAFEGIPDAIESQHVEVEELEDLAAAGLGDIPSSGVEEKPARHLRAVRGGLAAFIHRASSSTLRVPALTTP